MNVWVQGIGESMGVYYWSKYGCIVWVTVWVQGIGDSMGTRYG